VTSAEHAAIQAVEVIADEMVAFTRELVRVPTINPPGEAYADCAALIAERLAAFGYAVESLPAEGLPEHSAKYPRINVVGTLGDGSRGPLLHFNGHYDVVPPGQGWTVDPFGAELVDRRMYGRGTCDQKAGIAASIYAVEALRRAGLIRDGTIEQSATPDEESGGFAGVAWLCDRGRLRADRQNYVVITEPLDPERVCIGHRGVYWFEVTTLGRAGHGSMPGLAVNAVDDMTRVVRAFDSNLKPRLLTRTTRAPVEPPGARQPTLNLNAIHAGQELNGWQTPCVPDRCTAVFDRRFIHEEVFDDVRNEIVQLLDAQGVRYELRDVMRVDPLLGSPDGVLARATASAIRDVLTREPSFIVSPGTFDQKHVVRRAGIAECIGYGPGRLVLAHQPDEYVAVDDLVNSAKVMALLALRLCRG
jgi:succinyl-diaminopimelate desuccinylase